MPQPCSETFLPKPVRCWREDTSKNCMYKVTCTQVTGRERPVIQVDVLALLLTCETQRTIPLHVKVCNENHMNWKTDWILWMCVPGKKMSKGSLVYLSQQLMANIENKTVSLLVLVVAGCHARFWLQFYQVYPTITFNDSFKQPRLFHQSPRLVWSSRKTNPCHMRLPYWVSHAVCCGMLAFKNILIYHLSFFFVIVVGTIRRQRQRWEHIPC